MHNKKNPPWIKKTLNTTVSNAFIIFFSHSDPSQRPRVSLDRCIEAFAAPELITDFFSNATGTRGTAHKYVFVVLFLICRNTPLWYLMGAVTFLNEK